MGSWGGDIHPGPGHPAPGRHIQASSAVPDTADGVRMGAQTEAAEAEAAEREERLSKQARAHARCGKLCGATPLPPGQH